MPWCTSPKSEFGARVRNQSLVLKSLILLDTSTWMFLKTQPMLFVCCCRRNKNVLLVFKVSRSCSKSITSCRIRNSILCILVWHCLPCPSKCPFFKFDKPEPTNQPTNSSDCKCFAPRSVCNIHVCSIGMSSISSDRR